MIKNQWQVAAWRAALLGIVVHLIGYAFAVATLLPLLCVQAAYGPENAWWLILLAGQGISLAECLWPGPGSDTFVSASYESCPACNKP